MVPEELKLFVPLFDYALFDTKDIEDHVIILHFKRPSVKVAVVYERSDNLIEFIKNNPDLAREMSSQLQEIDETIFQKIAYICIGCINKQYSPGISFGIGFFIAFVKPLFFVYLHS